MKATGIDIDRMFEQLAIIGMVAQADVDDVSIQEEDLIFGSSPNEKVIEIAVLKMVDDTVQNGFDSDHVDEQREISMEFTDVWRVSIGNDGPAKMEPMKVQLKPD